MKALRSRWLSYQSFCWVVGLLCLSCLCIGVSALGQVASMDAVWIESIGFQQFEQADRVVVRCSDEVAYHLERLSPTKLQLVLENTAIARKNDLRELDTRYFDAVVDSIQAETQADISSKTVVHIELRYQRPARARAVLDKESGLFVVGVEVQR